MHRFKALILSLSIISCSASAQTEWYLDGSYRLRFETLDNSFRFNMPGSDQILASRLLLATGFRNRNLFGEFELEDSRTWLDDDGTPLGTDDVNVLEPLQVYLGWRWQKADDQQVSLKAGRMTIDLGSRRFLSRNNFRNTINAFSGFHADWQHKGMQLQIFHVYPLVRKPALQSLLADNERALDSVHQAERFSGVHLGLTEFIEPDLEFFLLHLTEDDSAKGQTRNRRINTLGIRILQTPEPRHWDYEAELAWQFGKSRPSAALAVTQDLEHRAAFLHGELGYRYADSYSTRLSIQFDYVEGDRNSGDSTYNHFDTLFGARRFEFGPTGIYGFLSRANILSPALRWEASQGSWAAMLAYRVVWQASDQDALLAANLPGNGDSFTGQQLEGRLRLTLSESLQFETGAAWFEKGELFEHYGAAVEQGDTIYWYSQISLRF